MTAVDWCSICQMDVPSFDFSHGPDLFVGEGLFRELPRALAAEGWRRIAVVTGGRSVRGRDAWTLFLDAMLAEGLEFVELTIRGEPSPDVVDDAYRQILDQIPQCELILAVGGGSVLDAAKATAAAVAMRSDVSIESYLEGVGDRSPDGQTLPVYAFPTTAGTGSEATRNAVLSRVGPDGFKKSLRHKNYVPIRAYLDAELHKNCPAEIAIPSGLDAITQLLESYISTRANPASDALALHGLRLAGRAFPRIAAGEESAQLRLEMATAAFFSGRTLANVGLGLVHGIASPAGALHDVPHGVVCGLLVGPVSRATIDFAKNNDDRTLLRRYADAGRALGADQRESGITDDESARAYLLSSLSSWATPLDRLSVFGFVESDLAGLAAASGLKNNPGAYSAEEIASLIREAF